MLPKGLHQVFQVAVACGYLRSLRIEICCEIYLSKPLAFAFIQVCLQVNARVAGPDCGCATPSLDPYQLLVTADIRGPCNWSRAKKFPC